MYFYHPVDLPTCCTTANYIIINYVLFQIADFGMARDVADDIYYVTTGGKIPVKWTAPEVLTAGLMHSVY